MANRIKCILIHPEFSKNSSLNYVDVCKIVGAKYPVPPLGLITVAALLPQDWNFKLVDLNTEPLSDSHLEWADIVCTGGMLSQQPGIFSIIGKAHDHGKKVVVGGPDPTCQPDLYGEADYLVLGEGENTIPLFLEDWNKGKTNGVYKTTEPVDFTHSVVPRYDLIKFSDYLFMGMQYSRGCPYNCEFCNVIELFGRKQRIKTVRQIIDELQYLYNLGYRGHIFFVDDNFLANGRPVEELLKAIALWSEGKRFPFYFAAESSVNFAGDDKLLHLMNKADFRYISIGLETPVDDILRLAQKQQNMNKSIPDIIRRILSYGIIVDASFILGFDNETEQTAYSMINCIQDSGICMAMVGTLFALPNTQLSERLKSEGRLFEEGTLVRDSSTEIDQMSSGLNFITHRARSAILKDYIMILSSLYNPENYYKRLAYIGLNLKPDYKHKPDISEIWKYAWAFLRVCRKAGFSNDTGVLFWKILFKILIKNHRALEAVVSFAAMYIHLSRHTQFIIHLTHEKIKKIEQIGEDNFNRIMLSYSENS